VGKLILFAGLPGSGKTTICQRIGEMPGSKWIEVDYYKKLRADPNRVTKEVDPPEMRMLYCQDALLEAFRHLDDGTSTVVMDEVFPFHSVRAQMESFCTEKQIPVLWVEVRASSNVAEKRLSQPRGNLLLHTPEVAQSIHRMCANAFEAFPAGYPNHIVINNEDGASIDLLAAKVLEYA
jgi:predicted kinase